jgi:hypothetical protein
MHSDFKNIGKYLGLSRQYFLTPRGAHSNHAAGRARTYNPAAIA